MKYDGYNIERAGKCTITELVPDRVYRMTMANGFVLGFREDAEGVKTWVGEAELAALVLNPDMHIATEDKP